MTVLDPDTMFYVKNPSKLILSDMIERTNMLMKKKNDYETRSSVSNTLLSLSLSSYHTHPGTPTPFFPFLLVSWYLRSPKSITLPLSSVLIHY